MPQRPAPRIGGDLILEACIAATLQVNPKEGAHIEATRALLCTDAAKDQCLAQGKRGALLGTPLKGLKTRQTMLKQKAK